MCKRLRKWEMQSSLVSWLRFFFLCMCVSCVCAYVYVCVKLPFLLLQVGLFQGALSSRCVGQR